VSAPDREDNRLVDSAGSGTILIGAHGGLGADTSDCRATFVLAVDCWDNGLAGISTCDETPGTTTGSDVGTIELESFDDSGKNG